MLSKAVPGNVALLGPQSAVLQKSL